MPVSSLCENPKHCVNTLPKSFLYWYLEPRQEGFPGILIAGLSQNGTILEHQNAAYIEKVCEYRIA